MADQERDELDELSSFFDSGLSKSKQGAHAKQRQRPNLIQEALNESTKSKPGRKAKPLKEKATKQVAGYVTPSIKQALDNKRGMISESKVIARLVERYVNGEIDI